MQTQTKYNSGVFIYKVWDTENLPVIQQEFISALHNSPEFIKLDQNAEQPRMWTLGGFGALGGFPSAWHAPIFRKLRTEMSNAFTEQVAKPFIQTENLEHLNYNIETLPDRPGIRYPSQQPDRETWHRDISPRESLFNEHDIVFGGWANLGSESQFFSYIPGSHRDANLFELSSEPGFAAVKDKQLLKKLDSMKYIQEIKPGEAIAFPQHILHEVLRRPAKTLNMRQFTGFRLTQSTKPLFNRDIRNQGVLLLPSGQTPRNYSRNHGSIFIEKLFSPIPNNKKFKINIQTWSENTFHSKIIETFIRKSGNRKGESYKAIPSTLKSLKELELPLYPDYTHEEIQLITPTKL